MEINPKDLSISTYNDGGGWLPTYKGVCIKHIPTGMSVKCDSERSQHANRAKAYEELKLLLSSVDMEDMKRYIRKAV